MTIFKPYALQLRDRELKIDRPLIMGIVNVTPDSFYAGSRCDNGDKVAQCVQRIVDEGGDIIDIGGYSTHPGASEVTEEEEYARVKHGVEIVKRIAPHATTTTLNTSSMSCSPSLTSPSRQLTS